MTIHDNSFRIAHCLDSEEMAAARRRELDIPRNVAVTLGQSAVEVAVHGFYFNRTDEKIDWIHLVDVACSIQLFTSGV